MARNAFGRDSAASEADAAGMLELSDQECKPTVVKMLRDVMNEADCARMSSDIRDGEL